MKQIIRCITVASFSFFLLQACKKSGGSGGGNTGGDFSDSIKSIVPQPLMDSLKKWGLNIYDGKTPPTVAGIYELDPDSCIFDNVALSSGLNVLDQLIDPYKIRFSNQDNTKLSIRADRKDEGGDDDAMDSTATFISGNGNSFTVFAAEQGVSDGINYTDIEVYSGQITNAGIANFQIAVYLKTKGSDPNHELVPPGTARIFVNGGNGTAASTTTYSIPPSLRRASVRGLFMK